MSFTSQITTCKLNNSLTTSPTKEESLLSELVRPGMHGERRIKQILLCGKYRYQPESSSPWKPAPLGDVDVAARRRHLVRKPNSIRLEGISWQRDHELDWTAYLPSNEDDTSVPIDVADDEGLGYYNCRILKSGDVISLNHRSVIVDFNYHIDYFENYVLGVIGSSVIEQHDFAHVNMPLDRRSGYLVLGRMDRAERSLEMTAFKVKPSDNVYIPANTIHTNDYLLGRWQTLLSSACKFPNARIKRPGNKPMRFLDKYDQ